MNNAAIWIVAFLVFFNSGAVLMNDLGVGDQLGVDFSECSNDELDEAEDKTDDAGSTGAIGSTIISVINTAIDTGSAILDALNPGAKQLKCAIGDSDAHLIIDYAFSGMWLVAGVTILNLWRPGGFD